MSIEEIKKENKINILDIEYFEITLIDIKSTVKNKHIICNTKNLYDRKLKYYAISYRWGETQEWRVQTKNYIAYVMSFPINNLFLLCDFLINKDKNINYLWIDIISINQENVDERKKTIYQMDKIYELSQYVIGVPDLCYDGKLLDIKLKEDEDDIIQQLIYDDEKLALNCLKTIFNNWMERTWVISERYIGIKHKKLKTISIHLNCYIDPHFLHLPTINLDHFLVAMLSSKSMKYEDRIHAIVPHTKYRKFKNKMLENNKIKTMFDLKITLLNNIDIMDQISLLLHGCKYHSEVYIPSFISDVQFDYKDCIKGIPCISNIYIEKNILIFISNRYRDVSNLINIETLKSLKNIPLNINYNKMVEILICIHDYGYSLIKCIGDGNKWYILTAVKQWDKIQEFPINLNKHFIIY